MDVISGYFFPVCGLTFLRFEILITLNLTVFFFYKMFMGQDLRNLFEHKDFHLHYLLNIIHFDQFFVQSYQF